MNTTTLPPRDVSNIHKHAAFRAAVLWLTSVGGFFMYDVSAACRLTDDKLRGVLDEREVLSEREVERCISQLTLLVQTRAARCEEYLNARGIVTGWRIWPTRWAKDEIGPGAIGRVFEISRDRHRPSLWERLRAACAVLNGRAPSDA